MKRDDELYIGIDPGKSGAVALLYGDSGVADIIQFAPSDGREALIELSITRETPVFAIIEHVHSMPRQGVASTFSFGQNFGWWCGVLDALNIPYQLVRPQVWKKEFGCNSDKNTSIAVAQRLFPRVSLLPTPKCKKPDDGMAEALLMAEYARRTKLIHKVTSK